MTVVDDFAADYFVTQGLTPGRRHDVRRALVQLEAHAGRPPEMVDDVALRAWVNAQVGSGLHVNTVRKNLNAVKPFFGWCWERRHLSADSYMRIKKVGPPRGATSKAKPRPYKRKEIQRFWSQLDAAYPLSSDRMVSRYERGLSTYNKVWRHAMHLQIQAITSLALFGGLRRDEIRLADIDDIAPENDYIVVRGKSSFGERQGFREVPYTVEGREMVATWLHFRALIAPEHDSPWLVLDSHATPNNQLAPSHPANPIKLDGFKGMLPRVGPWKLHRMRHTCATEWLRAGVELEKVSKLLGHSDIEMTLGYAELVRDDIARGMRVAEGDFASAVGRRNRQLIPE